MKSLQEMKCVFLFNILIINILFVIYSVYGSGRNLKKNTAHIQVKICTVFRVNSEYRTE